MSYYGGGGGGGQPIPQHYHQGSGQVPASQGHPMYGGYGGGGPMPPPQYRGGGALDPRLQQQGQGSYADEYNQRLMNPPAPSPYAPEYYIGGPSQGQGNYPSSSSQEVQDGLMGAPPRPHINPNFLPPEKPEPTKILRNPYPATNANKEDGKKGRKEETYDPSCPTLTGTAINFPAQSPQEMSYSNMAYQPQQQHQQQHNPSPGIQMVPHPNLMQSSMHQQQLQQQQQQIAYHPPPAQTPVDHNRQMSAYNMNMNANNVNNEVNLRQTPVTSYQTAPTQFQQQQQQPYQDNSNANNLFSQMTQMSNALSNPVKAEPTSTVKIMTGLVTQIQAGGFGMISEEIFFQQSSVSGSMPKVGDKVVVEAEPVNGMPFKYNAKRVTKLDMDLVNEEKSIVPAQQSAVMNNNARHQEIELAPLPALPDSLNLPKPMLSPVPLKSILKRNPPPPPILSRSSSNSKAQYPTPPSNRTSSAGGPPPSSSSFKTSAFSVDLDRDIPRVLPPSGGPPIEFPEYTYVKDNIPQMPVRPRRAQSPQVTRLLPASPITHYNERERRAPSPAGRRVAPALSPTMQDILDMNAYHRSRETEKHLDVLLSRGYARSPPPKDKLGSSRSPSPRSKSSRKYDLKGRRKYSRSPSPKSKSRGNRSRSRSRSHSPRSKSSRKRSSRFRSSSPRNKVSRRRSRSRSHSPRDKVSRRKSRSKSPLAFREHVPPSYKVRRSRSRSHSPRKSRRSRSHSPAVTSRRRSRSRTPDHRRTSKSPTRRSHRRSSRSRSKDRKRSRSPTSRKYRRSSRSTSKDRRSRSRSPTTSRKPRSRERQSDKRGSKTGTSPSWGRRSSSSSIRSASPSQPSKLKVQSETVTNGIVVKKVVSNLFPKITTRESAVPVPAKEPPKSNPVPIKFQISNPPKPALTTATMVPNPSFSSAPHSFSTPFQSSILNITKTVVNPSASTPQQQGSAAKTKKKEQEPAFKIIVENDNANDKQKQAKAVSDDKIKQWELERQGLKNKVGSTTATAASADNLLKNSVNILQLKQTIQNDLKELRQKGNSGNVGQKLLENPVNIEQLKQSVQRDLSELKSKDADKIQDSVSEGLKQLRSRYDTNNKDQQAQSNLGGQRTSKTSSGQNETSSASTSKTTGGNNSGRNEKAQRKNNDRSADSDALHLQPYDENLERMQEEIHQQRFIEEQHRLRSVGDEVGLQQLFYMEDRRRRRLDERNLARLRELEIQLKRDKSYTELNRLREEWGPTAQRFEQERLLREARKDEERQEGRLGGQAEAIRRHEMEYQQWLEEEATARLRGLQQAERPSRGFEGRVLRRRTPSPNGSHGHRGPRSGSYDQHEHGDGWDPRGHPPPHPMGFGPPPGHPDFFDGPPPPGYMDEEFHHREMEERTRMEEEMMHRDMEMQHRMEMGGRFPGPPHPHHDRGPPPPHRGEYTRFAVPRR